MSEANKNETGRSAPVESKPNWLDLGRDQVASLHFGTVLITVHDGRVVQVEKLDSPTWTSSFVVLQPRTTDSCGVRIARAAARSQLVIGDETHRRVKARYPFSIHRHGI
ncbi:MAG: YezD family protein [Verrucomicrobia bacterium]|nr:YezD family protein [Verrucomicrobiota bacterium]MBI3870148.1 YezD family protein [Verrucomicrobiota bacterium]